jgi:hypothetical protein
LANEEIAKLKLENSTLNSSLSDIGKERDFYFSKLRDIEVLIGKAENIDQEKMCSMIFSILTANKEVEVITSDNGEVSLKHY